MRYYIRNLTCELCNGFCANRRDDKLGWLVYSRETHLRRATERTRTSDLIILLIHSFHYGKDYLITLNFTWLGVGRS